MKVSSTPYLNERCSAIKSYLSSPISFPDPTSEEKHERVCQLLDADDMRPEILAAIALEVALANPSFFIDACKKVYHDIKEHGVSININNEFFTLEINQYAEVVDFLKSRQKVYAIKAVRMYTGVGLKEAKDYCDNLCLINNW